MASKKTVTADNLKALGVDRLAGILLALADEDAGIKRRLRLELAAGEGGAVVGAEVAKRLTALRGARSFVDWQKRPAFVKDLDLQRSLIVDRVADSDPALALDLMWRFLELAKPVFERVDDSTGSVGDVFRTACNDLGPLASKAKANPAALADRVFTALSGNDYGVYDRLVEVVLPALGSTGVDRLKNRLTEALAACAERGGERDWRATALRRALQDIADGEGNVDAYIALIPEPDRHRSRVAAEMAQRLLAAGRATEALAALEAAKPHRHPARGGAIDDLELLGYRGGGGEWEAAYIDTLDALGHRERAQACRWAAFEERLSVERLRAYLKALPDFDDVVAEDKAMAHARVFPHVLTALHFFHEWPNPAQAAELILARPTEIDGNAYYLLDPAARWLEGRYPLAATLLRRAMIEDTLDGAKSSRYKHAARHLLECLAVAPTIGDFGLFETHDAFTARLRAAHGRKAGFWSRYAEIAGSKP